MAAERAPEKLKALREAIARDAEELRTRLRTTRERARREVQEIEHAGRDVLGLFLRLLRRDSTRPPDGPS